jgi:phosphate transport system protein
MRKAYHDALKDVQKEMLTMAGLVGDAISGCMEALETRDIEASRMIVRNDADINRMRFDIEDRCMMLLATQQPMAMDLRIIAAVINIITDLERIGDHAEGIAKISIAIEDRALVKPLVDLPKMADKGKDMLSRCMKAFIDRDVATAREICDEDDIVDALYDKNYNELIQLMIEDPKVVADATYMIWAAHNLERIADRVTNIAERVVFMVTGKMEEMNVSKY